MLNNQLTSLSVEYSKNMCCQLYAYILGARSFPSRVLLGHFPAGIFRARSFHLQVFSLLGLFPYCLIPAGIIPPFFSNKKIHQTKLKPNLGGHTFLPRSYESFHKQAYCFEATYEKLDPALKRNIFYQLQKMYYINLRLHATQMRIG